MSIYSELLSQPISSISIDPITRVMSTDSISKALEHMRKEKTSHLLVFDKDNLLGIFTERDYLKKVFLEQDDSDAVITKYLTTPPITLSINHTVSQILEPMYNGHFRHLPIYTSKNNFIGVLTAHNFFNFLAELLPDKLLNLPPRPHQPILVEEGA